MYIHRMIVLLLSAWWLPAAFAGMDSNEQREAVSDGLRQEYSAIKAQQKPWLETMDLVARQQVKQRAEQNIPTVTDEDLQLRPELMHSLMTQALNSHNLHVLESLTAVYRQQPWADAVLLARAEGMIARFQGHYTRAVETYRRLYETHADDKRIVLDTAAILFEDRQWKEADRLFAEAETDLAVPEGVRDNIRVYRRKIESAGNWHIGGSASVAYDKNINDAAPAYCSPLGCVDQKAENAVGIHYQASVEKNTPLVGHHNLLFRSYLNGSSYYLDKKSQYDHAFGRAYLGWQYQTARTGLNVLPFYQGQLSGSDRWRAKAERSHTLKMALFSQAFGIQTALSHQINPRLQFFASAETYRQRYREPERAEHSNGQHYSLYASLAYKPLPAHTVFVGLGGGIVKPEKTELKGRINNTGNIRRSVSGGWRAVWPKLGGLNMQIQTAYTDRRYRGQALNTDFEWQQQRNRETAYSISVAHPKLSVAKLIPKLTWEQQRIYSTHKWAVRRNNRIVVEIEKTF
ncbi:surface lipoprotein assembly modifier [Neisseria sp. ZJ106]|uniref:Surface lipoprotein assembly modifier n=1 Tax=Neisseria lisongii TaxID=2912188 RepID=A0ABY7RJC8_9NEIS|nr:surface lipoprotein assembly modifier [Neisseria lisongii]MCF7520627.1 surface lipoprotein assembly modifier [Neisseria lisongii]WCL71439.1 surface lipoprotein assembly modifier [Neisseria lisongii]